MNVGLLCYDYSRNGGSEKVAYNLGEAFSSMYKVNIVSLFSENEIEYKGSCEFNYIKKGKGSFVLDFIPTFSKLVQLVKKKNINVILCVGINCSMYGCLLKRYTNARIIVCEHSNISNEMYNSFRQRLKRRYAISMADKIVTLTEDDKKAYEKRFPNHKAKCSYIYNWIDDSWLKEETEYDFESKRILTVCRLDRVKGIERSIEAFSLISDKYPDWSWDIYGSGDELYKKELEEMIIKNGLEKRFIFRGQANELKRIYSNYSLYVCSSFFEGMPIALLEAKSKKIPLISFNCKTGPCEIIENNINGILVEDGDVQGLALAIGDMINDVEKRIQFSNASYTNITKFKKETIIDKWINLIGELS